MNNLTNDVLTTLPFRSTVIDGESLDSWIEQLARAHRMSTGALLAALGLTAGTNHISALLSSADPQLLRRLEQIGGLPHGELARTVLDAPLGRSRLNLGGSRWCPACLTENSGRWLLSWRVKWNVACLRHGVLLHDTCPGCRTTPRRRMTGASSEPLSPAACEHVLDRDNRQRCGQDLSAVAVLAAGPEAIEAQHWVGELLEHLNDDAEAVLADLHAVCSWSLNNDPSALGEVADRLHPGRIDARSERDASSGDAALTAAALVRAKTILGADDTAALALIRHTVTVSGLSDRFPPPRMRPPLWYSATPRFQNRYLRAVDADLVASERLRLNTTLPTARIPSQDPPDRAAMIPQMIWPDWAGRLLPATGRYADLLRAAMSACLLIPGHTDRSQDDDIKRFNVRVARQNITTPFRELGEYPGDTAGQVVTALARIAEHLDQHGAGIDYQRRREHVPDEPIDWNSWRELACAVGAHPGDEHSRVRLRYANRHLHQLLNGADLADPRHPLAFSGSSDRSQYLRFTTSMRLSLRRALAGHAVAVLADLDIDEPLTWSPPAALADGLTLPGIDVDELDMSKIEQLIVDDQRRPSDVADTLGVHIEHIRFALERLDLPHHRWPKSTPPSVWIRNQQADQQLTREFFEREYLHAGNSLRTLAKTTGFRQQIVSQRARALGISVRQGPAPARIDQTWLREQYLDHRRTMADIAGELGIDAAAVSLALRRFAIPARAAGIASWRETNLTHDDLPAAIRAAVEATHGGWERLRRFQIAMQFPSIQSAAAYIGVNTTTLLNQFQRLERDLGGPLYQPYVTPNPQQPTPLGQALLDDLSTDLVNTRMITELGSNCPTLPDPRAREHHRPFDYLAVQPLSLKRGRTQLLRYLADRGPGTEFFSNEVAHATTGKTTTVHRLLTQMESANWITRRPETDAERAARAHTDPRAQRRIYYRFTPDGHRAVLRALQIPTAESAYQ